MLLFFTLSQEAWGFSYHLETREALLTMPAGALQEKSLLAFAS